MFGCNLDENNSEQVIVDALITKCNAFVICIIDALIIGIKINIGMIYAEFESDDKGQQLGPEDRLYSAK